MTTNKLLAISSVGAAALLATTVFAEPVAQGGRKFETVLTGAAEVPGPGDPDGAGTAKVFVNHGQKRVCYELTATNIATPTAAHIHIGAVGVAGGVVVPLTPPVSGSSSGCVDVTAALAKAILKNGAGYYVNVHNADFPAGAIRGQLAKKNH
jgi:hypothetical protein